MSDIFTMGIDIGSTASKCIILKNGQNIKAKSKTNAGTGTSGPERVINSVLNASNLNLNNISFIMATGYGRNTLQIAHAEMSELSCHAYGAHFQFHSARTVIDIGGQDAKVLRLDENGMLVNFVMNDKCAAGTGRFLDVMARVLEVKIEDLEDLSAKSKKDITISSTCTVFAESEVISQLASNADKCDIIRGIHHSVASRVGALARRIGLKEAIVMTGGVAQNKGVVSALEDELNYKIHTFELAQYTGALGAALFAYKRVIKNS